MDEPERADVYWVASNATSGAVLVDVASGLPLLYPSRAAALAASRTRLGRHFGHAISVTPEEVQQLVADVRAGHALHVLVGAAPPAPAVIDAAVAAFVRDLIDQPDALDAISARLSVFADHELSREASEQVLRSDMRTRLEQLAALGFTLTDHRPSPPRAPAVADVDDETVPDPVVQPL